jgi:hypothetical protein
MSKYQNAKIYCLRSHQTDEIYIGSTINSLSRRLSQHKTGFEMFKKGYSNLNTSYFLFDKHDDVYIELLENYPCYTLDDLKKREGELIRSNKCVNKCIAGRTIKKWRIDNKKYLDKYKQEYRQKHVEEIKTYNKDYYQKNKEKLSKQNLDYYHQNKDKYHCYQCDFRTPNYTKFCSHLKTKKHSLSIRDFFKNDIYNV